MPDCWPHHRRGVGSAALLFAVPAAAVLAACVETTEPVLVLDAPVTIVHASAGTPRIDVTVDGDSRAELAYGQATDRLAVRVGQRRLRIFSSSPRGLLLDTEITVRRDSQHTIIAAGSNSTIDPWILVDDANPPPGGRAYIRVVHASASAGNVDVYVTAPGDDLATAAPGIAAVEFGGVSDYMMVGAANYRVRVTSAGTQTVLADRSSIELRSRSVCTLVIIERPGGHTIVVMDG